MLTDIASAEIKCLKNPNCGGVSDLHCNGMHKPSVFAMADHYALCKAHDMTVEAMKQQYTALQEACCGGLSEGCKKVAMKQLAQVGSCHHWEFGQNMAGGPYDYNKVTPAIKAQAAYRSKQSSHGQFYIHAK